MYFADDVPVSTIASNAYGPAGAIPQSEVYQVSDPSAGITSLQKILLVGAVGALGFMLVKGYSRRPAYAGLGHRRRRRR
jgi:hypothetical protein